MLQEIQMQANHLTSLFIYAALVLEDKAILSAGQDVQRRRLVRPSARRLLLIQQTWLSFGLCGLPGRGGSPRGSQTMSLPEIVLTVHPNTSFASPARGGEFGCIWTSKLTRP